MTVRPSTRPSDAALAAKHFQEFDWERAKKIYFKEVVGDVRAREGAKSQITNTYFGPRG